MHACPLAAPGQGKSGGMNVYVRQLAAALGALGAQIDIFTRAHPGAAAPVEFPAPGVRVVHLPAGQPAAEPAGLFPHLPQFLDELRRFQAADGGAGYDAVHSHYWLSGWVGQRLAAELAAPHLVTFHTLSLIKQQSRAGETEPGERPQVEREVMAAAQRIIAFSPHEKDAMTRLYGADPARITLMPCGVDLAKFRPLDQAAVRRRLGLNGERVLLCVGRMEPLKGLDLLVETAAQLESDDELRMLVVGGDGSGGGELERLRRLAREREVDGLIDFVGPVAHDELPFYYNAADVCVVPSYYESFGLVALESMACGTPVVASRVGGLPTIVHHGHTGYLKSWRCPEGFANSVEMILSSAGLQEKMGEAARRRAENMGWGQVAAMAEREYRALLAPARNAV